LEVFWKISLPLLSSLPILSNPTEGFLIFNNIDARLVQE
jgi:hypothetical protein